ncbi:hypothetical protein KI387_040938 [Taxus chinensis]|uniref:Probable purine permease n=2 Tax=Taxus chinensis TaxID=29808 RepID=A0AA38C550_TAXCH|nr:hypothetical protein KI387_040938 [Taxus chinensis]
MAAYSGFSDLSLMALLKALLDLGNEICVCVRPKACQRRNASAIMRRIKVLCLLFEEIRDNPAIIALHPLALLCLREMHGAWPFQQPIYGPLTPPLIALNGHIGIDGMIINIATILAGAVTNPFNTGYFQGDAAAPMEAMSSYPGIFGKGAYPSYAGCPLLILPIWISSLYNKNQGCPFQNVHVTLRIFTSSFGIGILLSIYNALYSWCLRYLPLSTSAMVFASQLGFNTIFTYSIVRQKSTPYSINALIFLAFGTGILSFNNSSDRPEEAIRVHYVVGFILITSAVGLYGLILPLIKLIYRETSPQITYTLVMEMQLVMSVCASVVCTIDMVVYKDIPAIVREANASPLGEGLYYTSLLACVVCWQLFFIGVFGIIFPQLVAKFP